MHRVMREGTPAANAKFIGSVCRTATDSSDADAKRSSDTLLTGGINALQVWEGSGVFGWGEAEQ